MHDTYTCYLEHNLMAFTVTPVNCFCDTHVSSKRYITHKVNYFQGAFINYIFLIQKETTKLVF